MVKRIISILLVLVMVISMVPAQAVAAGSRTPRDVVNEFGQFLDEIMAQLEKDDTQEVFAQSVTDETRNGTSFGASAAPVEVVNTLEATEGTCGDGVFWTLQDGVLTISGDGVIQDEAFRNNTKIKTVVMEASITGIGARAFHGCSEVTEVTILGNVGSIGASAFDGCGALEQIVLPDSVTNIGTYAFSSCGSLRQVTLSKNLVTLGGSAFYDCDALERIEIPKSLEETTRVYNNDGGWDYRYGVFYGCDGLKDVVFEEGTTQIVNGLFARCHGLERIEIPDTVVTIEDQAFRYCSSLKSVLLPDSINHIGSNAFGSCPNLTLHCSYASHATLYAIENSIPFIPTGAFTDGPQFALDRSGTAYYGDLDGMRANGYVSMRVSYAIKESHRDGIEKTELQVLLPNNAVLDEMTLKLDGTLCTEYRYDGKRTLKVPVTAPSGELRFCVEMKGQDLYSYAALSVTKNGEISREIIGILNEKASILTINAPETIGTGAVSVSGIAPESAEITLLVDGTAQSTVTASKAGNWFGEVTIDAPKDYTDYVITAQCRSGSETTERSITVEYRTAEPALTGLVMQYNEHNVIKTWDLMKTNGIKPVIYFLPDTQFDFTVEFDHPESVDKVYVTSLRNQEKKYLEAFYDEDRGAFVTDGFFDESDKDYVPGKISVEYSKKYETVEVTDEYDWSIFDSFTENMNDETVTLEEVTDTDIAASVDLGSITEALKGVVVDTVISVYDEQTDGALEDWLGVLHDNDTLASYLIPGKDDKKYYLTIDYSDPYSYVMLLEDVSGSNYLKLILKTGEELTENLDAAYKLTEISSTLSAVNTAASLLLKQHEIETDMEKLREEVWLTNYATANEKSAALELVDKLEKDQMYFSLLSAVLPMIVVSVGTVAVGATMGAPVMLFTAILGFYGSMAPLCWQIRANLIKTPSYAAKFAVDPSGYVYDADTLARLEGVQVTAYCILEDDSEDFWTNVPAEDTYGTVWDASEYNQQNSLYTNADGKYAWDVPTGWWRVKCEKEGYVTTWSEWLPVPPPQTEVNIGMKSTAHAHAFTNYGSDGNATCTEDGTKTAKCDYCDVTDTIVDVGSALGHVFSEWIVVREPSTSEEGLEERTCKRCGYAEQRTAAKLHNPFADVETGSFYHAPVMWAVANGITNGTSLTTFGPNDQCMRAHVVTFLWRAVGCPEPTSTANPFEDVTPTDFFYKPVLWALENGITSGLDYTHFGPTAYCNRAQVVTFLYRAKGSPAFSDADCPFTDVEPGAWYEAPILWAVENGITNGMGEGIFGVMSICNRAQVVTFLYRTYGN